MSGRVTMMFGGIVLMALAGLDYGAAANARPGGRSLGVAEHVLDRFAQARAALGFAPPATATPVTSVGQAMATIEAALATANHRPDTDTPPDLAAVVASGDQKAVAEAAAGAFAKVAAGIEGEAPAAASKPARTKPGQITVGIGTCARRGAGKFCSVGAGG